MDVGMAHHLLFQLLRGAITNDCSQSFTAYVIRIALAFKLVDGHMHLPTDWRRPRLARWSTILLGTCVRFPHPGKSRNHLTMILS